MFRSGTGKLPLLRRVADVESRDSMDVLLVVI